MSSPTPDGAAVSATDVIRILSERIGEMARDMAILQARAELAEARLSSASAGPGELVTAMRARERLERVGRTTSAEDVQ